MTDGSRLNTSTMLLLIVGALVLLPLLFGGGMMGGGMVGGWMFLWPLLFVVLVVVLVSGLGGRGERRENEQAMTVLRERYARGELSDEEFEERRRQLRSSD